MRMGEKIKQLRKNRGMTQVALAIDVGVTLCTVQSWESGAHAPRRWALVRLLKALSVTPEEFYKGVDAL